MTMRDLVRTCPNCLTQLEPASGVVWVCPVCQFSLRSCQDCGGDMVLQVEVPDGVGIEDAGLPLGACVQVWVCQEPACGARRDSDD